MQPVDPAEASFTIRIIAHASNSLISSSMSSIPLYQQGIAWLCQLYQAHLLLDLCESRMLLGYNACSTSMPVR
jgi:hypothetical protein